MAMMSGKLDSISEGMNDMKTILREMSATQQNMAILMERQENHEENTKKHTDDVRESFKAVHARCTRNEEEINAIKKDHATTCDIVKPMAQKGEAVHTILTRAAIGLAVAVVGVLGTIMIWAIEQGGAK
jgi:chromosome segregation ATPase